MRRAMLVLAALVVVFAACVQASVGFAYALLAAPLLQLVSPELVPGPMLVSSFMLSSLTAWRERSSIDRRGVGTALIGRVPGAVLAGFAIGMLPARTYDVVFGSIVLAAVLLSLWSKGVRPTTPALLVAGFASGIMGTLTSVGGPPIALVYQHAKGPEIRSTLNCYFAIGCLISIAVLVHAEQFERWHLLMGLASMPLVGFGFYLSRFTRDRLDGPRLRPAVLWLAALSSLAVVVKALLR
jgi:uncharacterized membrane protein YfcA